jgi:DUF4097 and DUF4098 domain-containing protein YvlB
MRRETYETPGPLRLRLDVPVGRIEIEAGGGTTTDVELDAASGDMRALVDNARVVLRDRGDGHELLLEVQPRFGFFVSLGRTQDLRVRISCPRGADLDVTTRSADLVARGEVGAVAVKTASGDVSIDDAARDARVHTASGDVRMDYVGGTASVQTASGDVALNRVEGEVTAQLVSGDLWIRDANHAVSARTVSGDQRIEAVVRGAVELQSVSGDVLVGVRRGSAVYVDVSTVSGSTSSELELADAPAHVDVDTDGPHVELRAKTVSGDVSIVRAPAPTAIQAR